jgi:hypothetical protein
VGKKLILLDLIFFFPSDVAQNRNPLTIILGAHTHLFLIPSNGRDEETLEEEKNRKGIKIGSEKELYQLL